MVMPRTLKYFNLFVDGRGHAGTVDEIELPELSIITEAHRAGGMDTAVMIDMGMEPLKATFTIAEYDEQMMMHMGLFGVDLVPFTVRGALSQESNQALPLVCNMQGCFTKLEPGTWKAGDKTEVKYECGLSYYKLTMGDQVVYDIDTLNMKRVINGVDQLGSMRAAIGL